MPKATLTFSLPEEQAEYDLANKASNYSVLVWEFTNELRNKTKYAIDPSVKVTWDEVRDLWWQMLNDEGIDPYGN